MRKRSIHLTPLHLVAVTGIVLAMGACGRDAPAKVAADSTVNTEFVVARRSSPIGTREFVAVGAASRAEGKVMPERAAADAMTAGPPASPASVSNHATLALGVGAPLPPASDPAGAMLVRHGEASVEVRHVDDAVAKIRQTAQQFGGFVANTALRNGKDEQPSASLEIRVPTAQFDGLLGALRTLGKVETVTANAEDVGEEYVDLGARAANARRVEARLIEMLAARTGKLSDVLTVEQELARVRQEIERHDARLRWLERRAALSSLTVTLHEPLALIDRPRPGPVVEALALAWERTLNVIAWCIASLGLIVPVGVLVGIGMLLWRRMKPRRPLLD